MKTSSKVKKVKKEKVVKVEKRRVLTDDECITAMENYFRACHDATRDIMAASPRFFEHISVKTAMYHVLEMVDQIYAK